MRRGTGRRDAVWAAETVYEAKEQQPLQAFKLATAAIEQVRVDLSLIEQTARTLLEHSRIRIKVGSADDDAGETTDAPLDMDEQYAATQAQAQRLNGLQRLRLLRDLWPLVLLLAPAGAVALSVGLTRGWTVDAMLIGGTAGTLVLSLGGLVWLYTSTRSAHAYE